MQRTFLLSLVVVLSFTSIQLPARAQFSPGVFADARHPSGPPDPQKESAIWQVDPLTGALEVTIPFATTPVGGRGPKIPFALKYNSASTVTLQSLGLYYSGGSGTYPQSLCSQNDSDSDGCEIVTASAPMPPVQPTIQQVFQWSSKSLAWPTVPLGPWTTTGPYLIQESASIADQYLPGNQVIPPILYGYGCNTNGPYLYTDESGGTHDLNMIMLSSPQSNMVGPCQTALSYSEPISSGGLGYGTASATTDGSALQSSTNWNGSIGYARISGLGPTVIYPDGTQYFGTGSGSGMLEDSNGNQTTIGTDSLGRPSLSTNIPIAHSGPIPVGTYSVTTKSATGASQTYSVVFSSKLLGTFTMPHPASSSEMHISGYCIGSVTCPTLFTAQQLPAASTINGLTSVSLPNGTSYSITYDSIYGTISKITFPTGGYVRFSYGIRSDGGGYGDFYNLSTIVVTDAYVSDAINGEKHWRYSFRP